MLIEPSAFCDTPELALSPVMGKMFSPSLRSPPNVWFVYPAAAAGPGGEQVCAFANAGIVTAQTIRYFIVLSPWPIFSLLYKRSRPFSRRPGHQCMFVGNA